MINSVWILTKEYNEYDQYGEYFVAVFKNKPTHEELTNNGVERNRLRHTLNGGGRSNDSEDVWFFLREHTI